MSSTTDNRTQQEAFVDRGWGQLFVNQADPTCLDAFATNRVRPVVDRTGAVCLVKERQSLLLSDHPNEALDKPLEAALRRFHLNFRIQRRSAQPLPAPSFKNFPDSPAIDLEFLTFVSICHHSLVRCGLGLDRSWLIAEMVWAWPKAKFAIATATCDEARRICKALRRRNIKVTLATTNRPPRRPGRVVIGTYSAFQHTDIKCNHRHFAVAANAAHTLSEAGQWFLRQDNPMFRVVGLLPENEQLSPSEQDWLVATFGVQEITIPCPGCRQILPRVIWLPFQWHSDPEKPIKRIHKHHVRNRKIAQHAKSLARCVAAGCTPQKVIVLVHGVDHALALAKKLTGWPIVCAGRVTEFGLHRRDRSLLAAQRTRDTNNATMIVTADAAETVSLDGCETVAVIWASGGKHLPPLPRAWFISPAEAPRGVLLYDIEDCGDWHLAEATQHRKRAYWEAEWLAPGENPLTSRVQRFLSRRPRRAAG